MMDIEKLKAEFEQTECFKRLEHVAQYTFFEFGAYIKRTDVPADIEKKCGKLITALLFSWSAWKQAKAHEAKKLEGCVVVPKDQIEVWWQDSEEPENFATKEDDLSFIAQHIQDDEIMEINEHHTIHLPSITKFGAWVYQSGQRTFFVGNKDEVEAARGGNDE
ncbi:hypothetical protein [Acinetobacter sp. ANC5681]|uniref:hypothetical protein n=1 Tax=Acinetobacter sp. ANC5681 TaxID=2929504 RepID=UPI00201A6325|nr:hypothetical protein [Acinetobacter sp. ANC5681]MCL5767239.1 hypothetical protein [Acinetobacter sp. ANC5681]